MNEQLLQDYTKACKDKAWVSNLENTSQEPEATRQHSLENLSLVLKSTLLAAVLFFGSWIGYLVFSQVLVAWFFFDCSDTLVVYSVVTVFPQVLVPYLFFQSSYVWYAGLLVYCSMLGCVLVEKKKQQRVKLLATKIKEVREFYR